jgi:ribosomal protein S18 acetylase RimI-like enzyme
LCSSQLLCMAIDIRRATPADVEALLPLVRAYRVFYEQTPDPEREHLMIAEHLAAGRSIIFIASTDSEPVGFVQLFTTYSTVLLGPSVILEDLYVDPNIRRSGVATQLLECGIGYAREIGATGMFLETAMDNVAAQAVYERAGWTREDRFYKYNAPPQDSANGPS